LNRARNDLGPPNNTNDLKEKNYGAKPFSGALIMKTHLPLPPKKRLGLIAMSGIRAENQELLELGLTLPGFVERSKVIASLPSLSLLTLAGLTPDAFELEYHEVQNLEASGALPDHFNLVAITSLSAQISDAYQVADRYRAAGTTVVMGGLHVSARPDEAKRHCDAVVLGEGEPVWRELLDDFSRDRLRPFYVARERGEFDLARAPLPRFDLLDPDRYNRLTVQTSRGCPHRCAFCASSVLLTPRYKLKPVERVLAEIRAIKQIWERPFIEFADDNSFVHKAHYRRLMRALLREDLRWFTECDLSVADDPELLGLMRDAGCQQVLIGLESPRAASLEGLEGRNNWKARRREDYLSAIERIQERGITVNGCFILGLDGDTPEVFDEVLAFVRESGLYEVQITLLTPFPGTPLYPRLEREGRILDPGNWNLCTLFDVNLRPRHMTPEQLHQGFLRLGQALYSEAETRRRRQAFRDRWRRRRTKTKSRRKSAESVAPAVPDRRATGTSPCSAKACDPFPTSVPG
jgi:radical SAM superfamily enzyme YgiQ (UPF0313 family)